MITTREKETFHAHGLLCLERFLPADKVRCARDIVLKSFERQGLWKEGNWRLDGLTPSTSPTAGATLVRGEIKRAPALRDLMTAELRGAIAELLDGRPLFSMTDAPQLLFTLPNAESWAISPSMPWHLDIPRLPEGGIPGVQIFTFLNSVMPGGGGTLVVSGSHRLLNLGTRIGSQHVKRQLQREPYFRDLMSDQVLDRQRFLREPGRVGDVELQVVEMYGEPGDVYLMDMRMLHAVAPNATHVPRMMLTQRFLPESLRNALFAPGGSSMGSEP